MIEYYKILTSMIALDDFSVQDLAKICGVSQSSVRSIMDQKEQLFESIDNSLKVNKDVQRFRISPSHRKQIRAEINVLFKLLIDSTKNSEEVTIPITLLIAEDIVAHRIMEAKNTKQKEELLALAILNYESAKSYLENHQNKNPRLCPKMRAIEQRFISVRNSIDHFKAIE